MGRINASHGRQVRLNQSEWRDIMGNLDQATPFLIDFLVGFQIT